MAVTILGEAMPTSMATVGDLRFPPHERLAQAGNGRQVVRTVRSATWKWRQLTTTEFDYLAVTVCDGNHSQPGGVTDATILNDPTEERVEVEFRYGVVDYPEFEKVTNGIYYGVTLTIRNLIPYVE